MSPKQMSQQHDQSKKRKEMKSSSSTTSYPMHFFKVILPQHIEDKRMKIPKEFLKKIGKELSDTAIIKLPRGPIIWSIGLTEKGGVISFEHGWPEFMDFFSISVGHMLVFRYDGNSSFHVLIFSPLATEIDYAKYYFRTSNFKDKAQVIELDSSSTHGDNETASTQSESSSSSRECGQVNLKTEPTDEHDSPKRRKVYANTGTTRRSSFNTSLETQSKERALAEAEALKSKNPFFRAIMHPSCASRGGNLHVPAHFANPYLQHKTTRITLRISDGKSWEVGVNSAEKQNKTTLCKGWCRFVADNQLNQGDVLVFELVDRNKFEMNVKIFRACTGEKLETDAPWAAGSKEKPAAALNTFKPKKPFFKITMYPSYLTTGCLFVPAAFASRYLKPESKVSLTTGTGGKNWEMQCSFSHRPNRARLSKGWSKFVLDNHLNEGDVCYFELVDRDRFVMKAHIIRV